MIYVLEGCSGSGKSTFAKSLIEKGYKYKKLMLPNRDSIINELLLNKEDNIVYDRLFINSWLDKSEFDILELNYALNNIRDNENIKFVKFNTSLDNYLNKRIGNNIVDEKVKDLYIEEYYNYNRIFSLMNIFEEVSNGD